MQHSIAIQADEYSFTNCYLSGDELYVANYIGYPENPGCEIRMYKFDQTNTTWDLFQTFTTPELGPYGSEIDIYENTLITSHQRNPDSISEVYLYTRVDETQQWSLAQTIRSPRKNLNESSFGLNVGVYDDRIIISDSPGLYSNYMPGDPVAAVYIYRKTRAKDDWELEQSIYGRFSVEFGYPFSPAIGRGMTLCYGNHDLFDFYTLTMEAPELNLCYGWRSPETGNWHMDSLYTPDALDYFKANDTPNFALNGVFENNKTYAVRVETVFTSELENIEAHTATLGGEVVRDYDTPYTTRGVCWSTSQDPTVNDSHQLMGSGIGAFSGSISELNEETTYYVRAYAIDSEHTEYGKEKSFTTPKYEYAPQLYPG